MQWPSLFLSMSAQRNLLTGRWRWWRWWWAIKEWEKKDKDEKKDWSLCSIASSSTRSASCNSLSSPASCFPRALSPSSPCPHPDGQMLDREKRERREHSVWRKRQKSAGERKGKMREGTEFCPPVSRFALHFAIHFLSHPRTACSVSLISRNGTQIAGCTRRQPECLSSSAERMASPSDVNDWTVA